MGNVTTTITRKGATYAVLNNGSTGPPRLWSLERLIDSVATEATWPAD